MCMLIVEFRFLEKDLKKVILQDSINKEIDPFNLKDICKIMRRHFGDDFPSE